MRTLDLGNLSPLNLTTELAISGALGDAAFRLTAYMTWPENEHRRKQYLATKGALALAQISRSRPEDLGLCLLPGVSWEELRKHSLDKVSERHFLPHGGFDSVADAPGVGRLDKEVEEGFKTCVSVGKLLVLIRTIALDDAEDRRSASINKALHVLDALNVETAPKRTSLLQLWGSHKSVAHIGAAFLEALSLAKTNSGTEFADQMNRGYFFFGGLGVSLALALQYQEFGLGFFPHGQNVPLLPSNLWSIPEGIKLPEVRVPKHALSSEMRLALAQYRAPKAI